MKLKHKNLKFWQFYYELQDEYDLDNDETAILGYLMYHCTYINDDGYCGYTDEKMAEITHLSEKTFKRKLKDLREKRIILVRNPGKRNKKPGESRVLTINPELYVDEVQGTLDDLQAEEVEKLRSEVSDLRQKLKTSTQDNDLIIDFLVDKGLITYKEKQRAVKYLKPLYRQLITAGNGSLTLLMKHISYVEKTRQREHPYGLVDNVAYLQECARRYLSRLADDKREKGEILVNWEEIHF